jgi:hypothetical protein
MITHQLFFVSGLIDQYAYLSTRVKLPSGTLQRQKSR